MVVFFVEVLVNSSRLVLVSKTSESHYCIYDVEAMEEKRKNSKKWQSYQRQIIRAYDKRVRSKTLKVGGLFLKQAKHLQKGLNASKFILKWERPYIICEAYDSGLPDL